MSKRAKTISRTLEGNHVVERGAGVVKVLNEPVIYEQGNPDVSFFRDVLAVSGDGGTSAGTRGAAERLDRHNWHSLQMAEERAQRSSRSAQEFGIMPAGSTSDRALSNAAAAGGQFLPPTWMTEKFAAVSLAACPLKGLVTAVDLPDGTLELHIPRFDLAGGVGPQAVENTNVTDDFSQTDGVTAPVVTFTGDAIISQALFDRGGSFRDSILMSAFAAEYAQMLQSQLVSGTGTNGQMLGLLNVPTTAVSPQVPGANITAYTAATPSPAGMIQQLALMLGNLSDARDRPASAFLMRDRRYRWLSGYQDPNSGEVAERPGTGYMVADGSDVGPTGPLVGLPVYLDQTLPQNIGAAANQDLIVALRTKDVILLEDPNGPRFTAYAAGNAAGQLSVVVAWHHYAAAFTSLYPSAIATLSGTGLVVPH